MTTLGCRSLTAVLALLSLATPALAQQAVILVRHAEKETDPAKLVGLNDCQVPLSKEGETRADALAFVLKDAGVSAIYTSDALRTQSTARPLAGERHIEPKVFDADALRHFGERNAGDVVLIVGHSAGPAPSGVPAVIDALLKRPSGVVIGESEFDHLFVLYRRADGSWRLVRSRY
jgi:hypothetical protein